MPKYRAAAEDACYDPKQILFEQMLLDRNGYISPDEIYQQEVMMMARQKAPKVAPKVAPKKAVKKPVVKKTK